MRRILLVVIAIFFIFAHYAIAIDTKQLSKETGIPIGVIEKVSIFGKNPNRLMGSDLKVGAIPVNGITIDVPASRSFLMVEILRMIFGNDYIVFVSEQNFDIKKEPDKVAILNSKDPFDAVRVMGTCGINYDITSDQVLQKLKDWDKIYGLTIVGAGPDWVQATFKKKPNPMLPFANEVFKFCPDIVWQGTNTVEALSDEMYRTNTLYLWWD